MTDEIDDFDLADDETAKEQRQLGLIIPTLEPGLSLSEAEDKFRKSKTPFPMMFTVEDEQTGEEIWETTAEGEKWRRVMEWPVVPSVAEVEQYQAHRIALAETALWERQYGKADV